MTGPVPTGKGWHPNSETGGTSQEIQVDAGNDRLGHTRHGAGSP